MAQASAQQRAIQTSAASMGQIVPRLQAMFDALFSLNSGTTAPPNAVQGMHWLDTSASPAALKQYTGSAWVTVGTLDASTGQYQAVVSLPANTFLGRLSTAGPGGGLTVAQMQDALVVGDLVGMVAPFAANAVPTGWLKCNGQLVSRTVYARLFAKVGTTYGAGNGSTTFALPDLRGDFVRGLDEGAGLDPSRTLGSYQADALGPHIHNYDRGTPTGGGADGLSTAVTNVTTGASGIKSAGTGIGTETRPKNVAMPFFIKF